MKTSDPEEALGSIPELGSYGMTQVGGEIKDKFFYSFSLANVKHLSLSDLTTFAVEIHFPENLLECPGNASQKGCYGNELGENLFWETHDDRQAKISSRPLSQKWEEFLNMP